MLESLISFDTITKRPYTIFVVSFILASLGFILGNAMPIKFALGGNLINLSGVFSIIFILLPTTYMFTRYIIREESFQEKYIAKKYTKTSWKRYRLDAVVLIMFFFGSTFSFAFWSFFLPADFFQVQQAEIGKIISGPSSYATASGLGFREILLNNANVMFLGFIFSLLFGAGVVFVLLWNSSLLGVRIAQLSSSLLDIPSKSIQFLPHGIFEIAGFVLAGLAGGMISAAVVRGYHKKGAFEKILFDSVSLLMIAFVFIAIGAWIEVI